MLHTCTCACMPVTNVRMHTYCAKQATTSECIDQKALGKIDIIMTCQTHAPHIYKPCTCMCPCMFMAIKISDSDFINPILSRTISLHITAGMCSMVERIQNQSKAILPIYMMEVGVGMVRTHAHGIIILFAQINYHTGIGFNIPTRRSSSNTCYPIRTIDQFKSQVVSIHWTNT